MSRFKLPVFSGVLLALCLYPFYAWPLVFVALAPLFYFLAPKRGWDAFWGGCIAGCIGTGPTVYFSLAQLLLFPNALAYTYFIRVLALPVLIAVSLCFGCMALLYAMFRPRSVLLASALGAALYVVLETLLMNLFGGYYYAALSPIVAGLAFARALAAFGGALFVSVWVVWANVLVAEGLRAPKRVVWPVVITIVLFAAAAVTQSYWSKKAGSSSGSGPFPVSIIQTGGPVDAGTFTQGAFTDADLAARLTAAQGALIIYPYSPTQKGISPAESSALGMWLKNEVPASSTVLVWNTEVQNSVGSDQLDVWHDGTRSAYSKHRLYFLSDTLPPWLTWFGIRKSPIQMGIGTSSPTFAVGSITAAGLICSELHQQGYVRSQAALGQVLVAVGWDSMFPGDLAGNFSLAVAQYRAAENGTPLVRGNLIGPSALIDAHGAIDARLGWGKSGRLFGVVRLEKVPTLFDEWGNAPSIALCVGVFGLIFLIRRRDSNAGTE